MDGLLASNASHSMNLLQLVEYYHRKNPKMKYKTICAVLNQHHGVSISERRLKYICKKQGLSRKRNVNSETLKDMVINELRTSSLLLGYRQMTELLAVRYGVSISKEDVRKTLKNIDPDVVTIRRNKVIRRRIYHTTGPGYIYHIDENDKLKRWGFPIHGCIDGFSRKVMWLVVSTTNNDPLLIGNLYLNCIKQYKIVPVLLRMDAGTENIYCQDFQVYFTGEKESFLYASSTRSQRIEAFWSRLKRYKLSLCIDFFTDMTINGIFKPDNKLHEELLLFVFMPILQKELNEFLMIWNIRNVRQSVAAPGGVPDVQFHMPGTLGFQNQGIGAERRDIDIAEDVLGVNSLSFF